MKKAIVFVLTVVLASSLGAGLAQREFRQSASRPALSEPARDALLEALAGPDGEYASYATYRAIVEAFGPVEPYASILESEARHIQALQRQLDKYGASYPANPYLGRSVAPATLAEAAATGVDDERANIAMFDRLLAEVGAYPDLVRVFTNLQRASAEGHLPHFEAALAAGGHLPELHAEDHPREYRNRIASETPRGLGIQGVRPGAGRGPHGPRQDR